MAMGLLATLRQHHVHRLFTEFMAEGRTVDSMPVFVVLNTRHTKLLDYKLSLLRAPQEWDIRFYYDAARPSISIARVVWKYRHLWQRISHRTWFDFLTSVIKLSGESIVLIQEMFYDCPNDKDVWWHAVRRCNTVYFATEILARAQPHIQLVMNAIRTDNLEMAKLVLAHKPDIGHVGPRSAGCQELQLWILQKPLSPRRHELLKLVLTYVGGHDTFRSSLIYYVYMTGDYELIDCFGGWTREDDIRDMILRTPDHIVWKWDMRPRSVLEWYLTGKIYNLPDPKLSELINLHDKRALHEHVAWGFNKEIIPERLAHAKLLWRHG